MPKWLTLIFLVMIAGGASAEETRLRLVNGTKYGIREVSISPQDLGMWRPNVLKPPPIKPGESRELVLTSDFRDCNQDLTVVFTEIADQPVWGHLNLCDLRRIRLNYDATSGITTAAYEE